jgi:hypothetical protein
MEMARVGQSYTENGLRTYYTIPFEHNPQQKQRLKAFTKCHLTQMQLYLKNI